MHYFFMEIHGTASKVTYIRIVSFPPLYMDRLMTPEPMAGPVTNECLFFDGDSHMPGARPVWQNHRVAKQGPRGG